ncbi:MAG: hypothetical protein Q8S01_04000, partial [Ignavibacteria bacterium]|nr:hypothetical protein [Ignavibacteria bacterium]
TKQVSAKDRCLIAISVNFITWKDKEANFFRWYAAKKYFIVNFEEKISTFCRTLSNMLLPEFMTL